MNQAPIQIGGITIRFLVEPGESDGSVSVFRCDMAGGSKPAAPHSHDAFDETMYGLSGVITVTVDGTTTELRPGEAVFIPRGAVHGFVVGDEDASMLCVASPGLFGPAYFREMGEVFAAPGPPDLDAAMAVMRRHGLTPARGL